MSGKLTIQHWKEQQDREAERGRQRDEALRELTRDIASVIVPYGRRRKRSLLQRLFRIVTMTDG